MPGKLLHFQMLSERSTTGAKLICKPSDFINVPCDSPSAYAASSVSISEKDGNFAKLASVFTQPSTSVEKRNGIFAPDWKYFVVSTKPDGDSIAVRKIPPTPKF